MADLETIPTTDAEAEEERKRRALEALNAQPAVSPNMPSRVVAPIIRGSHPRGASDLELAESVDRSRPSSIAKTIEEPSAPELGQPAAVNTGLQPLSSSPVKALSFAERQALPTVSPGAPAGSAASHEARLERLQDQERNPWGSPENHPGFGGKLAHVLSKVGNIAGTIVAPSVMELIPGTDLNRKFEETREERLGGEAQTRETAAKGEAERERHGKAAEELESRRLDIEEGKEGKQPTIDQAAIDAKMKETNPDTDKPYTAYEARIELANDIAAGKASARPAGAPKTIVMQGPDKKNYEYEYDAKGNYAGDEGYQHWKKIGPAKPDAMALGLIGTLTPMLDPQGNFVGTFNSKTGEFKNVPAPGQGGNAPPANATSPTGARLKNTEANQFNTQVVNPARTIETNFQKAKAAIDAYNANPQTGAAGMVLFAQHLGTTLGGIKGAAIGEHSQELHRNAIGLADRVSRWVDQNATGQPLAESQVREFYQLIQETRNITWQLAARAAQDRKQKANFLPDDVQINMKDSKGTVRKVPGGKVQDYLDKGAEIE